MQSSSQIITTNKPTSSFFTGRMPFLSPNQQCQSTEGKNIIFHGLAHPKLTWGLPTLSLTTNSSWLPWGSVAMPLISPLMPVPQYCLIIIIIIMLDRDSPKQSSCFNVFVLFFDRSLHHHCLPSMLRHC